jgi:hypothetical protein
VGKLSAFIVALCALFMQPTARTRQLDSDDDHMASDCFGAKANDQNRGVTDPDS